MLVAGLDYASRGISALALARDGKPLRAVTFQSDAPRDESDATMLREYEHWLHAQLGIIKPDLIVVEELAVFHNVKVVRALSHREAVALLVARRCKSAMVIHRPITQARKVVFQKGNISKDDAWEVRAKYIPNFDFGRKTTGGTDIMDAMTLALAAPTLLERS